MTLHKQLTEQIKLMDRTTLALSVMVGVIVFLVIIVCALLRV